MLKLFKRKPKFTTIIVWARIVECNNYYIVDDFKNKKCINKRRYIRMAVEEKAKKELKEYRENILYIREQQDDIEEVRAILEKTTTKLSLTKTDNNSMSTDKFSDGIDRISRIEQEKDKKLAELLTKKFVVDGKIDRLEYPFRDVLFMRYTRGKSWEEIARILKYDRKYVFEVHGKALQKYAEL